MTGEGREVREELAGGSTSDVIRVGDTVRRVPGPWTPAVHSLLRHLERVGFDGAPRALGYDDDGREVLTFIEGATAHRPWPAALLVDDGLIKLGKFARAFHDAAASFVPDPGAVWVSGRRPLGAGEIVCHGDFAPWNIIWRDDAPVALIDWDDAEPALPISELGQLAFFVVPMRDDAHCLECGFASPPDRAHRLRVLLEAYGAFDPTSVVEGAEHFWLEDIRRIREFGPQGIAPWAGFLARGIDRGGTELLEWLRRHRDLVLS